MDYRYEICQVYSPNFSHFPLPLHVHMSFLYVCVYSCPANNHVLLIVTKWCVHACTECMRQRRNVLPASWGNKGKSLNARKNSFINFWSGVSNSKTALDISHPYSSTRCFFIRTIASQIKHRLDWVGKTAAEINGDNCGERVLFFFKQ